MNDKKHKRFIAGVVCPQCKQADKTIVYEREQNSVRECVSCGHREALDQLGGQHELPTRVNQYESDQADLAGSENQPLRILDPRSNDPENKR